jgi:hypothetical protein
VRKEEQEGKEKELNTYNVRLVVPHPVLVELPR